MFWGKIPVLVDTNMARDVLTSHQKYVFFVSWKWSVSPLKSIQASYRREGCQASDHSPRLCFSFLIYTKITYLQTWHLLVALTPKQAAEEWAWKLTESNHFRCYQSWLSRVCCCFECRGKIKSWFIRRSSIVFYWLLLLFAIQIIV